MNEKKAYVMLKMPLAHWTKWEWRSDGVPLPLLIAQKVHRQYMRTLKSHMPILVDANDPRLKIRKRNIGGLVVKEVYIPE